MTTYRVAVQKEDGEAEARTTEDREEAVDWFGYGIEAVFDDEDDTVRVAIEVDGVLWGAVAEPPEGEGEVIERAA